MGSFVLLIIVVAFFIIPILLHAFMMPRSWPPIFISMFIFAMLMFILIMLKVEHISFGEIANALTFGFIMSLCMFVYTFIVGAFFRAGNREEYDLYHATYHKSISRYFYRRTIGLLLMLSGIFFIYSHLCSGQAKQDSLLEVFQYCLSASFGVNPSLC